MGQIKIERNTEVKHLDTSNFEQPVIPDEREHVGSEVNTVQESIQQNNKNEGNASEILENAETAKQQKEKELANSQDLEEIHSPAIKEENNQTQIENTSQDDVINVTNNNDVGIEKSSQDKCHDSKESNHLQEQINQIGKSPQEFVDCEEKENKPVIGETLKKEKEATSDKIPLKESQVEEVEKCEESVQEGEEIKTSAPDLEIGEDKNSFKNSDFSDTQNTSKLETLDLAENVNDDEIIIPTAEEQVKQDETHETDVEKEGETKMTNEASVEDLENNKTETEKQN